MNTEIPEKKVNLEQGYYRCAYDMLWFKKEVGYDSKEGQANVEDDNDDYEMEDTKLDDERELFYFYRKRREHTCRSYLFI